MTYIKRIVMRGFKSFPKKTEIPFTPGINVLLGPNGSGKSNIPDAICFVLGRLSIKSIRAAKVSNLIFLGTKSLPPAKEAFVEVIFDNSKRIFSVNGDELSIKRIIRKKGQSLYKINDETKTRQEVLTLLAQAGIDPHGFNIILQNEIHNFVKMQPEERRKVIEEVSGISVYETRKEKSLRELEKTEEKLKEIGSILRERTAYLNNLEKERQQALKYKKLESDLKKLKKSIIYSDLQKKKKEEEKINEEIEKKVAEITKQKKTISEIENEIQNLNSKIDKINSNMQEATGFEQEKINQEIANLRADLASLNTKLESFEAKLINLSNSKEELRKSEKDIEELIKELQKESPTPEKKQKEIEAKKKEIEKIENQIKKFYAIKSELNSLKERISDKNSLLQNYENESNFLIKQTESLFLEIFDSKANSQKLDKLKTVLAEKKSALSGLLKREIELEKITSVNESEIENLKKITEQISKIDICPICKSKITPEHITEINKEVFPKITILKKEINSSDSELKTIYQKKEILVQDIEEITQQISKTESDLNKIININEKKSQIKILHEKFQKLGEEIQELDKKKKKLEESAASSSNLEQKYEILKVEVQEISLRTRETLNSEVDFKQRELDRIKISLKQINREEAEIKEEILSIKKIQSQKEKTLIEKRQKEEELAAKFKKMISSRDSFHSEIRKNESEILSKRHVLNLTESKMHDFRIEKAKVDAEIENLEIEIKEFEGIEIIRANREILVQRLTKVQEILSTIGTVNLRSLEVYDSIKKEYDSIKEKSEIISKEKDGILKIISEIDIKKKRTFFQALKQLNELFSRNFSQLSNKATVFLELENKQNPFEGGVNIVVKTGHGKYFDVKSLSGGEQALIALSQIFAIQEYKPYYFYLLDEIDASLDKRNSERLAGLLVKYMQKGQYIVISHNDEVISRATNLYGVSMHDGVSKIITLKV
ncbi:chromosome segregation protein SMC [Candidatus Pacearchaeota archaeon]|nr:chromosome segregation protein SMC [Candidatus Pacearchaeota archaeon]